MSLVDAETGERVEAVVLLSKEEAQDVTVKIKQYAGMLCHLVKRAHDGGAWKVLGYPSWAAYCAAEFDVSRSYAYRLVAHAQKIMELSAAAGLPEVSPMGDTLSERVTRDLDVDAARDAIADAVADLPDDATDEDRATVASQAVEGSAAVAAARARREREAAAAAAKPDEGEDASSSADPLVNEPEQDAPSPAPAPTPDPTSDDPPSDDAAAASSAGAAGQEAEGGGSAAPALGTDRNEWQRIAGLLVQAHALTSEEPVAVVAVMTDADREVWCAMADDLSDWAFRFGQAVIEANQQEDES